jgi:ceramide glucosyltransferase
LCGVLFYLRKKPELKTDNWPKVACLKPLCGYDFETFQNLKSFLAQDYPDYEVIFGVADKEDNAYQIARSVCSNNQSENAMAVIGEIGSGANRKVRNLRNIESHIAPDAEVLVLSDSDTRVTKDYLKHIIAPIHNDATIGAVTSIFRIENTSNLGDLMEAFSVESVFVPGVLIVAAFSKLKYAFGASIAVKRSEFLEAGGFREIEDYLADDYKLGSIIFNKGRRVVLSPYVVSILPPKQSLRNTFKHLVRWGRTIRVCEPIGYFCSIVCHSIFWALMVFVATGAGQFGWIVLGGTCIIRILTAAVVSASIGSRKGIMRAVLAPIWDLLSLPIYLAGILGNKVTWRGVKFRVFSDGRMAEIK